MRRVNDERGAVAVLVAISMVVIIGMAAFVIDVAALHEERRELQNGADAAALAIAQDCFERLETSPVTGVTACLAHELGSQALASQYGDANALDDQTVIDDVDVVLVGSGSLLESGTATVDTSTLAADGATTEILFTFAQIFDDADDGQTVHARARAEWGPVGTARSIPLTVDECEFHRAPYGTETALVFHDPSNGDEGAGACPSDTAGKDLPGGFGWLDGDGDCTAVLTADSTAEARTGDPTPSIPGLGCDEDDFAVGSTITMPIHSTREATGTNGVYQIEGFATFVVTGYRFTGGGWTVGDTSLCNAAAGGGPSVSSISCLQGYFTTDVVTGTASDGESFGTTAINLVTID